MLVCVCVCVCVYEIVRVHGCISVNFEEGQWEGQGMCVNVLCVKVNIQSVCPD